MKSFLKIFRYYFGMALCIFFLLLIVNIGVYMNLVFKFNEATANSVRIEKIAQEFSKDEENKIILTKEGSKAIGEWAWGMLLDEEGNVIWQQNLPVGLDKKYTLSDVAAFAKWYLEGYPVSVYENDYGLLVLARDKDSEWKHMVSVPLSIVRTIVSNAGFFILGNILLIILLYVLFSWRFNKSLKRMGLGMESLAAGNPLQIQEKGMTADIARQLNQTGRLLTKQREMIEKRDSARTSWVAGVSHDIRTPLSMIMGYSDQLSTEGALSSSDAKKVQIIKEQSLRIKQLIADLNLISKLEYNAQPLRMEKCQIGPLLRQLVTEIYNNGLDEKYEVALLITPEAEKVQFESDKHLLMRAFENILGNSIRHNESGCHIVIKAEWVSGNEYSGLLSIIFTDDGDGIPEKVLQKLQREDETEGEGPHIMGLYVVKQIIKAHGGTITFSGEKPHGTKVTMQIPINKE